MLRWLRIAAGPGGAALGFGIAALSGKSEGQARKVMTCQEVLP
jgi:hypothetical protein